MIQKEHLKWLISVPATDCNFTGHLKEANAETIFEAIKILEKKDLSITKLKKLKSELKRKETFVVIGPDRGKTECIGKKWKKQK
jgi:hypothetical protein